MRKVKHVRIFLRGPAEHWYILKFIPEREIRYLPYVADPIPKWTEFCNEFFKEFSI